MLKKRVFSLQLMELPPHTASILIDECMAPGLKDLQLDVLMSTLRHVWVGIMLTVVHGLWAWRIGIVMDPQHDAAVLRVKARDRLRQWIRTLPRTFVYSRDPAAATAERAILLCLLRMWTTEDSSRTEVVLQGPTQYVCFFDGGSRGKPSTGGSGSVIVAVDRTTRAAAVVWFAYMAYGIRATTNNVAEYWGLVRGLQYAKDTCRRPLHVVRDSSLILHQVQQHKQPKAKRLVPLHTQATRLATAVCDVMVPPPPSAQQNGRRSGQHCDG